MCCFHGKEQGREVADNNRVMSRPYQQNSAIPALVATTNENDFRYRFTLTVEEGEAPRGIFNGGEHGMPNHSTPSDGAPGQAAQIVSARLTHGRIAGTYSYRGHSRVAAALSVTRAAAFNPRSRIQDAPGFRSDLATAALDDKQGAA